MIVKKRSPAPEKPAVTRGEMAPAERQFRSRLTQLASGQGLLRGTILERFRTCGNLRCKCARGQKHRAVCLVLRQDGRLRQLYIPRAYEERVRQWVANHQEIKQRIAQISDVYWQKVQPRQG
jgi:hypothetical protein